MRGGYIRQERPYVTFAALFVSEKREKKKSFFMFLRGRTMFDPTIAGRRGIDTYAKRWSASPRQGNADHHKIKSKYNQ